MENTNDYPEIIINYCEKIYNLLIDVGFHDSQNIKEKNLSKAIYSVFGPLAYVKYIELGDDFDLEKGIIGYETEINQYFDRIINMSRTTYLEDQELINKNGENTPIVE
jgi:hypothetical protein